MSDLADKVQALREAFLLLCKDAVFGQDSKQSAFGDPGRYPTDLSEPQPDAMEILLRSLQLW